MGARVRTSGRSTPARPDRGGTSSHSKTTDNDSPMATATSATIRSHQTAKKSTPPSGAASGRLPRRRPLPPRRPAAEKSPSTSRRSVPRRSKPAPPPSRTAHPEADTTKPTARKHPRDTGSHETARPRSTTPTRQRRPDPISHETERGLLSRSVEAVIAWLKNHVHRLMDAMREHTETVMQNIRQQFREWMDTLVDTIAQSDAGINAVIAGIRAALTGKNPVWAAIKALVSGLSGKAKVALVLVLVLGSLLAPVLLVVLLLVLVVAALVAAVRAAAK
ncbi:hypothetical protein OPAG_09243 [Rhodococcus opacus PD630]|nr:hypothetical protein OPAG_09243 [Rhodococcus opacus PD630]